MPENTIVVQDLHKSYGRVLAVRGISFQIGRGECFGLLGPNGAGKTTTVEMLEGLLEPSSGSIEVLGRHWGEDDRELRERLGVCLQQTVLSDKLSVRETVELFRRLYRDSRPPDQAIAEVALEEKAHARVGTLSGGQKQRLAVALALVGDPDILFLDEPTTGLDPQSRRQLWDVVTAFKARGRTVVLTTHYMDEAERLCDRLAVIDHGRIIAEGSPADLVHGLGGDHVVEVSVAGDGAKPAPADLEGLPSVSGVQEQAGRLVVTVGEPHVAVPELLRRLATGGWELASLSTRHASLEDVFVSLTGRHLRDE